jgi:hypothetical protein
MTSTNAASDLSTEILRKLDNIDRRIGSVERDMSELRRLVLVTREDIQNLGRRVRDVEIGAALRDSLERARPFNDSSYPRRHGSYPLEPSGDGLIESSLDYRHPYSR